MTGERGTVLDEPYPPTIDMATIEQLAKTLEMHQSGTMPTRVIDSDEAINDPLADRECRGKDPNIFYPQNEVKDGPAIAAAKVICGRCVVKGECLQIAIKTGEKFGIWGGLTTPERRRLVKQRAKAARSSAIS